MSAYVLENFGCRATQADGAAIEQQLLAMGLERASAPAHAQVMVLNTCTVTAAADADARAAIRRIHRENPACKIMVTGCYAQRAPEELAALPGVTWVVGNSHKQQVARLAAEGLSPTSAPRSVPRDFANLESPRYATAHNGFVSVGELSGHTPRPEASFQLVGDIFAHTNLAHTEMMAAPVFEGGGETNCRTRPNLKVQDGCDNRCSFCVIPFVRGQSRSLPLDSVLRECDSLVAAGYREVVISGINLGRWGRDLPTPQRFEALVNAVLERTAIERLRISSVEPMDWSAELIDLMASSERICKHAHVPLQSGSDQVLRMMHRKYRPWHYADRIRRIRAAMPEAAIGADVMVGFPGETDALFEENRKFIAELPFTYLHVFTYSSRPGTAAAKMPDHVPVQVARARNRILRELIAEKNAAFRRGLVGKELEAITLHGNKDGSTDALTNNFLKLRIAGDHASNQLLRVAIRGLTETGLAGAVRL
ncbi:MAG: tRNA (N(6)-L-threonylcarbamoyladenosine(37)-C(2))-methylthiotransferase MtaB [Terriglobales bacterium]